MILSAYRKWFQPEFRQGNYEIRAIKMLLEINLTFTYTNIYTEFLYQGTEDPKFARILSISI